MSQRNFKADSSGGAKKAKTSKQPAPRKTVAPTKVPAPASEQQK